MPSPLPLLFPERNFDPRGVLAPRHPFPSWDVIREETELFRASAQYAHLERRVRAGARPDFTPAMRRLFYPIGHPQRLEPNPFNPSHARLTPSLVAWMRVLHRALGRNASHMADVLTDDFYADAFTRTVWRAYGRKVYVLDPLTYSLLAHSDLPPLPIGEIAVPVPSFYLYLPESPFRIAPQGREQPIDGLFLSIDRDEPGGAGPVTVSLQANGVNPRPGEGDHLVHRTAVYGAQIPLSEIARTEHAREGEDGLVGELLVAGLGLLLYLMSEHAQVKPVPPSSTGGRARRNRPGKRGARSRLGYLYVGGREDAVGEGPPPTGGEGKSLDHTVWVRGHFRNQAHGPGHALRKLIWVKPHVRGPDFAESVELRAQKVQPGKPAEE